MSLPKQPLFSLSATGPIPVKVFISYSHEDTLLERQLLSYLQARGFDVWTDSTQLKPGTPNWEEAIRGAVREVDVLVYLASPAAAASSMVNSELRMARNADRQIIPLFAQGEFWEDVSPMWMSLTQYLDARGDRYTTALADLAHALADLRSPQPTHALLQPMEEQRTIGEGPYIERLFVGRSELARMFDALLARLRDQRQGSIYWLYGPTGSGKTWLLEHFRARHASQGVHFALVDLVQPQDALDNLLRLFKFGIGGTFDAFTRQSILFRQVRDDRSAEPQALNQAKLDLVAAFARDLHGLAAPVTLMIDTFEKTSEDIEKGVYTYFIDQVLTGALPIVLVIAGWNPPARPGLRVMEQFTVRPVPGLAEQEVQQYMRRAVAYRADKATARQIMELTATDAPGSQQEPGQGSNPLKLMMFTDILMGTAGDSTVTDERVSETLTRLRQHDAAPIAEVWVERLLSRIPSEYHPLIRASVAPHQFTEELLAFLTDAPHAQRGLKFIQRHLGVYCDEALGSMRAVKYHEEVRHALVTYLSHEYPAEFTSLHLRCAQYFDQRITAEWLTEPLVEAFYHWLLAGPERAAELLREFIDSQVPADQKRLVLGQLRLRLAPILAPGEAPGWDNAPLEESVRDRILVPLLLALGKIYQEVDNAGEALMCFKQAEEIVRRTSPVDPQTAYTAYLGEAYAERWINGSQALSALEIAAQHADRLPAETREPAQITIATRRADIFRLLGTYPRALVAAEEAYQQSSGHFDTLHMLGRIATLCGRVQWGLQLYARGWAAPEAGRSPRQHAYLRTHFSEAYLLAGSSRGDEAFSMGASWAEKSLAEMEAHRGDSLWPLYFGIGQWNLARNREGESFGCYRPIPSEEAELGPGSRRQTIGQLYLQAVAAQVRTHYVFGEGWIRLDMARFLARCQEWEASRQNTLEALERLLEVMSWHKIGLALHNLLFIEYGRTHRVKAPLAALTTRIARGERSLRVQKAVADVIAGEPSHLPFGLGARTQRTRRERLATLFQYLPDEPTCWHFDVLARLAILRGHAANTESARLVAYQDALGQAICHSPYEAQRCWWEIAPHLGRDSEAARSARASLLAYWEGKGPSTEQMQVVTRIWRPLTSQGIPRSFAEMEAGMLTCERDAMAAAPPFSVEIRPPTMVPLAERLRDPVESQVRRNIP